MNPNENPNDLAPQGLDLDAVRKRLEGSQGKEYWRSLDELANTEAFQEFMHKEFPRQAAPLAGSVDRRDVLKLLGASLALGGLTSCIRPNPQEQYTSYVRAPEYYLPGVPQFYATAMNVGGYGLGVLAESHAGRPTKLEGNADHPASLGATDAITQAMVLSLYDPDRSQALTNRGELSDWASFTSAASEALGGLDQGAGLRILSETVTSPTLASQIGALLEQYPNARWHRYDPLHRDNERAGAERAFGEAVDARYHFENADVVLSLGSDFLGSGPGQVAYTKAFSGRRRVRTAEDAMNRLWVAEVTPSTTGSMADHRLALRPAEIEGLARALAASLGLSVEGGERPETVSEAWFNALVEDLDAHRGSSLVVAGPDQPAIVHAVAHALNAELGNVGETVVYTDPVEADPVNHGESLAELVNDISNDEVEILVMLGGNPAYTAPADLSFANLLPRVPLSVHLSPYQDETSLRSTWHVPQTHDLEAWSDIRAFDGSASIVQPLIAPFYNGKSTHEVVAALAGDAEASGYTLVRDYWREQLGDSFNSAWGESVHDGVVSGSAFEPRQVSVVEGALSGAPSDVPGGLLAMFQADPSILDGRFSNNGWLQELPNPFTKLTWDNAALMSPATAERLGVINQDLVTLTLNGNSVDAPVWIMPGQADDVVVAHLGYGRSAAGVVGNGQGFNAYTLRPSAQPWVAEGLELSPTGGTYPLSSTQMHHALEEGRHIVRHGTLAEFQAHPDHPEFVHPVEHHEYDLYPDYEYETYAWGMVIDMNVCTGCNACVTACQSENNIPIVGKSQVAVGREMHWIRVDSYYGGSIDEPEFYHQPLACMHCEKAPCEPVCPVGATVHDHEGLNVMVYNRCVGTRYCSNNCPYKVRRFNFLQYAELEENALAMVQNPDVTVRSRGVMEKCTYCVQRISKARVTAENQNRQILDGEVVTACQAACPAEAIVFGDINDSSSDVVQTKASPLNYGLLAELNTVPRTSYITKLRNPHPALAGATSEGSVTNGG